MKGRINNKKITALIDDSKSLSYFIFTQVQQAVSGIQLMYSVHKTKTVILIAISLIFIGFPSIYFLNTIFNSTNTLKEIHITTNSPRGDIISGIFNNGILSIFTGSVHLLSPVIDGFVGNTPDVTGYSNNNQIAFGDGGIIQSASDFYNKTFSFALLVLVFLLVITGIRFITNSDSSPDGIQSAKELLIKLLWVGFFLIAGKILMSLSIQMIDALNSFFRGGMSLSTFITDFADKLVNGNEGGLITSNIISLIAFSLILILLFIITIQFIIRFVSLYFLAVIQPISSIFSIIKGTGGIHENFWKNWFSLLIHQPFFILGFAIMESILASSLKSNITLTPILILLAILLFLTTIHTFTSKVFTDFWDSGHNYANAHIGKSLILGGAGLAVGAGVFGYKNIKGLGTKVFSKDTDLLSSGNTFRTPKGMGLDAGSFSRGGNKTHTKLIDPTKSYFARKLSGLGKKVSSVPEDDNKLGIAGSFYAVSNGNGISTLYDSRSSANEDGFGSSDIREVNLNSIPILDTSNFRAKSLYNSQVSSIAKDLGIKSKEVHLTNTSSPDRILKGMEIAKEINLEKGVSGVAVERIGKNIIDTGDPRTTRRQVQIYLYDDILYRGIKP